jgi:hypothetical protein
MQSGKYLFSQLFEVINRYNFDCCVKTHNGNFSVKSFTCWQQFLIMSFAQFSFRESLRDIEYCLSISESKLYHCGIGKAISRSALAKANENRSWEIYRDFANLLMPDAAGLYEKENALAKELNSIIYAFDSTTIDLCLNLFPWAKYRKGKSAVKIHVLLNISGAIPEFVKVTRAKIQDHTLIDDIPIAGGAFYLMDRGYIDFNRLYRFEKNKAFFVTRAKSNMSYEVVEKKDVSTHSDGIIKDEMIMLTRWHTRRYYPVAMRKIEYLDNTTGTRYVFLSNHLELDAIIIARLYKERWNVELFFKWIKQHLRIKKFYGLSDNAVKTQIWIAVCDYLIIAIIKKQLKVKASIGQMMQAISVSLFEKIPLQTFFEKHETKQIGNQASLF